MNMVALLDYIMANPKERRLVKLRNNQEVLFIKEWFWRSWGLVPGCFVKDTWNGDPKGPLILLTSEDTTKAVPFWDEMELSAGAARQDILNFLAGFTKVAIVTESLTYASRGLVLDVFDPFYFEPLRLVFKYDIVEEIKFFSPGDQLKLTKVTKVILHRPTNHKQQQLWLDYKQISLEQDFAGRLKEDLNYNIFDYNDFKEIQNLCQQNSCELKVFGKEDYDLLNLPIPIIISSSLDTSFRVGNQFWIRLISHRKKKVNILPFFRGDYLVHQDHGIGKYLGFETINSLQGPIEVIVLEYANGKIMVPILQMNLVCRYGGSNNLVALDRIGSVSWQERKEKTKRRLKMLAEDLIKRAAKRNLESSLPCNYDAQDFKNFSQGFPYKLTIDQIQAIHDIEQDLKGPTPMDRLICGDAGFGKTEIANNAIFMMLNSGYQALLVTSTSILCHQHLANLRKRFGQFSYRIAEFSRFNTDNEGLKKELANGKIDLLVATPKVFHHELNFANLGLVVVDEEQHLGVKQKEKLKKMRVNANILTLSATPIPRTLQISLYGLNELSLVNTPPAKRMQVITQFGRKDDQKIKDFIAREMVREGQVFFVSPRTQDLDDLERYLKTLMDKLRIAKVHGKMSPRHIEKTMHDFATRKYDILLSTNIIESGVDLPVNTIIINRAELFGLSSLYQLRGRVGRGTLQAYAYFLVSDAATENSLQRLEFLAKLDYAGSGFALASYDLDLRGSGNILGEEQSGHIKEVGLELYNKLLEECINGNEVIGEPTIKVDLPVGIPKDYIKDSILEMAVYQELASLQTVKEIKIFQGNLIDRFGPLPESTENLLKLSELKILAKQFYIAKIEAGPKGFQLGFRNPNNIDFTKGMLWVKRYKGNFLNDGSIFIPLNLSLAGLKNMLHSFIDFVANPDPKDLKA